jgi:guanylate kinase
MKFGGMIRSTRQIDYTDADRSNQRMDDPLTRQTQIPLLIVISGPSGVGKDSVIERMKHIGAPFHFVITATTRPIRADEVDGVDYFFVSRDEFEAMIENDELLEHAVVYKDYKGIPKQQVREAMQSGKDVVMRLDVQGAETIRNLFPEALLIFLTAGSEQELLDRLEARRTETQETKEIRINMAKKEMECVKFFDYIVINSDGKLDAAVDLILAIIQAEHHRVNPRQVQL